MNLDDLVTSYVDFRRTLGEKCLTNAAILRSFCRAAGLQTQVGRVRVKQVAAFLAGTGPITNAWHVKYSALKGFFQFAVSRGYLDKVPLPKDLPKRPSTLVPYVYSHEELRRLLDAIPSFRRFPKPIEPPTVRAILLTAYGAGLRRQELLDLSLADVDMPNRLLTIRNTKFFKSRLVPIGRDLAKALSDYASWRCTITTRNQRLAAIHAMARFIGLHAPELVECCRQVRSVPFKKAPKSLVTYLEKPEMDAVLATPDMTTAQGRRDHALLLFLYNAGARADEAAQVQVGDLTLPQNCDRDPASVLVRGKGSKSRRCPLWPQTVRELVPLIQGRGPSERLFLNRCGRPMTRFGIHALVERSAARAAQHVPSLAAKQVSPHTIRHTTATHLLRSGVDINTIRAWLGHVSLTTTNVYAEVDLEMKAKALANCEVEGTRAVAPWRSDKGLMEFLRTL
jgi:integrase/recombinase XerD